MKPLDYYCTRDYDIDMISTISKNDLWYEMYAEIPGFEDIDYRTYYNNRYVSFIKSTPAYRLHQATYTRRMNHLETRRSLEDTVH